MDTRRNETVWNRRLSLIVAGMVLGLVGLLVWRLDTEAPRTAQAQGDCGIAGVINVDRTLSPSECDPYIVTGNLIVDEDASLAMEPGTTLSFDGQWSLTVRGTLIAQGTASNEITFTSGQPSPAPGDWGQIVFEASSPPATFDVQGTYTGGNVLQYVIVEYGGGGENVAYTLEAQFTTFYLDHSTIRYNDTAGVRLNNFSDREKEVYITNNQIYDNINDGVSITDGIRVVVTANTIANHRKQGRFVSVVYGIFVESRDKDSVIHIANNTIENNEAQAITWDGQGNLVLNSNRVISNTGGILFETFRRLSGNVQAQVRDNLIRDNQSSGLATDSLADFDVLIISGNQIQGNTAQRERGGGILLDRFDDTGAISVTNNAIRGNTAQLGGGIYVDHSRGEDMTLLIAENTLRGNHATQPNGGGALALDAYTADNDRFTANELLDNTAADPDNETQRVPQDIYNSAVSSNAPFNARGNIWGTDDRAEIQARIYDGADDTSLAFVDFEDFRLESPRSERFYNAGEGGSQESTDGAVTMTIPGGAITEPTTITHRILSAPTLALPTGSTPRYSFSTSARTADGGSLDRFAAPITLVIDIPTVLAQNGETGLNVAYRDGVEWVNLLPCEGCSISETQATLVTDRLGEFALVDVSDTGGNGGDNTVYLPLVRK